MQTKLIMQNILLLLCTLTVLLQAQNPTYEARLLNGVLIMPNQLEFDIYIKRTGTIQFEAYGLQHCLIFDKAFLNGGTPVLTYIFGTSEMNYAQIPYYSNITSVVGGKRVIKIAARIPSGPGAGTIISNIGFGTRFGRFRLATSGSSFLSGPPNLDWNFNQTTYGYLTKYQAYVGSSPADITVQSSHTSDELWCIVYNKQYEAYLMNDSLVSPNSYEFDIYLKGINYSFDLSQLVASLTIDDAINGGGQLSTSYIAGTNQSIGTEITYGPDISTSVSGKRVWKLIYKSFNPYHCGLFSTTGFGTRVGRFRITTSAPSFSCVIPNLNWNFNSVTYGSKTEVYACGYHDLGVPCAVNVTNHSVHYNNLSNPVLPVELISFSSSLFNDRQAVLNWATATETNNYGFEIERKCLTQNLSQGEGFHDWEKIGFVAGSGNSTSPKSYTYLDNSLTGGRIFSYRLKQIDNDETFTYSSIQEVELILNEYVLSQNYPNPFNPTTTIEYIIPEDGQVSLSVYNLLGEKVEELINEFKESGIYTVDLDATNLSSGSYIYVLRANGNTVSKKLTILK